MFKLLPLLQEPRLFPKELYFLIPVLFQIRLGQEVFQFFQIHLYIFSIHHQAVLVDRVPGELTPQPLLVPVVFLAYSYNRVLGALGIRVDSLRLEERAEEGVDQDRYDLIKYEALAGHHSFPYLDEVDAFRVGRTLGLL